MTFVNNRAFYIFILAFGMSGYELVAGVTQLAAVVSTPYSMAFRAVLALASAWVLVVNGPRLWSQRSLLVMGFAVFWLLYSLRLLYDSVYPHYDMMYAWWYYCSWVLGACFLPMMAMASWSPTPAESRRAAELLFALLVVAGLLAALLGTASPEIGKFSVNAFHGRFHLAALNPISMGHLGGSIFLLALWHVIQAPFKLMSVWRILAYLAICLGAVLLIAANSKGPLLSVLVCLIFMVVFAPGLGRRFVFFTLLVCALLFAPLAYIAQNSFGIPTYSRMVEASLITGGSTPERLQRLSAGFADFMASPLLGSRIEESQFGGYPHNIILEALMATGVLGGSLLFILLMVVAFKAMRVYRTMPAYGWVSILFVQHFIAAQVSGAVYTVSYLWMTAGALIGIGLYAGSNGVAPLNNGAVGERFK